MIGGTITVPGPNLGQQTLFGVTMPTFSNFLSNIVGRSIQDKTGLTGKYHITYQMEFPQENTSTPIPPDFLSSQIFTIVRDQLGLELKTAKGLVETLDIDHVQRPSEN